MTTETSASLVLTDGRGIPCLGTSVPNSSTSGSCEAARGVPAVVTVVVLVV
jgi:hypothetical protein